MRRFFVPKTQIDEQHALIMGQDVNHMKNVLRMNIGDAVALCDGYGTDYEATIKTIEQEQIVLTINSKKRNEAEAQTRICLYQALPKADKMELIIEKSVELGVSAVVPVYTERCIVKKLDAKKTEKKQERWQKISESAAKQSGRGIIPEVKLFEPFKQAIQACDADHKLILWETENQNSLKKAMENIQRGSTIAVFIGPEGGLTQTEVAMAKEHGWQSVTIGKRILRTETAGMATVAAIMFGLDEME
jgi:16S rRNA (uracil1498-N3)-methyltransferase